MGKIIAIAQHKGGTGKTTTAINVAASLCDLGKKVLIVDMDPQASCTLSLGVKPVEIGKTTHHLLVDPAITVRDTVLTLQHINFQLVPASVDLALAEAELVGKIGREKSLLKKLTPVKSDYDFILIDCPPTLGLLVINALAAADTVLIPVQCEPLTLYGINHLLQVINLIKEDVNPGLKIEGILRTMFDRRTKLSQDISESIGQTFGELLFKTIIYRHIKLAEGPVHELPVSIYAKKSPGAAEYRELAGELLSHG